ncbi:hypothetical protein KIW84_043104 [Lathyrus oleraceus]|uniref:Uncharacterized protein n=1 Tax=Pisum sativum TaxID=3888 RepID=A0A9D4XCY7_PEA|nr:hypothetical protein KIW84_043104 [Pisum sativum]
MNINFEDSEDDAGMTEDLPIVEDKVFEEDAMKIKATTEAIVQQLHEECIKLKELMWKTTIASYVNTWENSMLEIKEVNEEAFKHLMKIPSMF